MPELVSDPSDRLTDEKIKEALKVIDGLFHGDESITEPGKLLYSPTLKKPEIKPTSPVIGFLSPIKKTVTTIKREGRIGSFRDRSIWPSDGKYLEMQNQFPRLTFRDVQYLEASWRGSQYRWGPRLHKTEVRFALGFASDAEYTPHEYGLDFLITEWKPGPEVPSEYEIEAFNYHQHSWDIGRDEIADFDPEHSRNNRDHRTADLLMRCIETAQQKAGVK